MKYKYFVLDKENDVTIKSTKSFDTVYKTCGYRKNIDFTMLHSWASVELDNHFISVSLWGKHVGKTNNINNSNLLKNVMTNTIYGNVVFVFTYDENIFSDINMSHWNTFKEKYLETSAPTFSESEYTFDEDTESDCDNTSIEEGDENIKPETINMKVSNELKYEPYYVSSDEE